MGGYVYLENHSLEKRRSPISGKKVGGLGFKEFRVLNLTLLAKQGWRLIYKIDKPWARLLYFPTSSFLQANKGDKASWIWASLCDARETLQLGLRKNLMDVTSINAYSDPWIPTVMGFKALNPRAQRDSNPTLWMTQDRSH
ncbi:hypothetical protein LINPERHAP2_LOCUS2625 [Linum perenne]